MHPLIRTWSETTVRSDEDREAVVEKLSQGETFVIAEGFPWVVYWNDQGDEVWMRPPTVNDQAPIGQVTLAEYHPYPYIYVHAGWVGDDRG